MLFKLHAIDFVDFVILEPLTEVEYVPQHTSEVHLQLQFS